MEELQEKTLNFEKELQELVKKQQTMLEESLKSFNALYADFIQQYPIHEEELVKHDPNLLQLDWNNNSLQPYIISKKFTELRDNGLFLLLDEIFLENGIKEETEETVSSILYLLVKCCFVEPWNQLSNGCIPNVCTITERVKQELLKTNKHVESESLYCKLEAFCSDCLELFVDMKNSLPPVSLLLVDQKVPFDYTKHECFDWDMRVKMHFPGLELESTRVQAQVENTRTKLVGKKNSVV